MFEDFYCLICRNKLSETQITIDQTDDTVFTQCDTCGPYYLTFEAAYSLRRRPFTEEEKKKMLKRVATNNSKEKPIQIHEIESFRRS